MRHTDAFIISSKLLSIPDLWNLKRSAGRFAAAAMRCIDGRADLLTDPQ